MLDLLPNSSVFVLFYLCIYVLFHSNQHHLYGDVYSTHVQRLIVSLVDMQTAWLFVTQRLKLNDVHFLRIGEPLWDAVFLLNIWYSVPLYRMPMIDTIWYVRIIGLIPFATMLCDQE